MKVVLYFGGSSLPCVIVGGGGETIWGDEGFSSRF